MQEETVSVVMPAYNEEGSIEKAVELWYNELSRFGIDFTFHVYNDGSNDQTLKLLNEMKEKFPLLVVHDKPNEGHGPTIYKGYTENIDCGWFLQVDADNEVPVTSFEEFWNKRDDYDFLIGERTHRDVPFTRKFVTFMTYLTIRVLYGPGIKDINCPFRLMRTSAIKPFLEKIPPGTFSPNAILSGLSVRHNLRVYVKKVRFQKRTAGTVSLQKAKLIKAVFKSFFEIIYLSFR